MSVIYAQNFINYLVTREGWLAFAYLCVSLNLS